MIYSKPQLTAAGCAVAAIQSGVSKTSTHADASPPIDPPDNATATAYEADE